MLSKELLRKAEIVDDDRTGNDFLLLYIPTENRWDTSFLYQIHKDHRDYRKTLDAVGTK